MVASSSRESGSKAWSVTNGERRDHLNRAAHGKICKNPNLKKLIRGAECGSRAKPWLKFASCLTEKIKLGTNMSIVVPRPVIAI
jgi:hypothetical protein